MAEQLHGVDPLRAVESLRQRAADGGAARIKDAEVIVRAEGIRNLRRNFSSHELAHF